MKTKLIKSIKPIHLLFFFISFTAFAQKTYVPDDVFEQALIDLGYDTEPLDNYVPTDNISAITSLNVSDLAIKDLTGIEDFAALKTLKCYSTPLSKLNLSSNTALENLWCYSTSISELNLSNNTALKTLYCGDTSISELDLSSNTTLEYLKCGFTSISKLDLSNNTALKTLYCHYTSISELNLSKNTSLEGLDCRHTSISELNLSSNTALETLNFSSNPNLKQLNIKNGTNENIYYFLATNCPNLTCIQVDNATYSKTNWTDIDNSDVYNKDCFIP